MRDQEGKEQVGMAPQDPPLVLEIGTSSAAPTHAGPLGPAVVSTPSQPAALPGKKALYKGIPGRTMPRARARRIHAFHDAAFWLSVATPVFVWPLAWVMGAGVVGALAAAAASLVLAALIACTVTDLMSMRIPNGISALPLAAAVLWWVALALGFPVPDGEGVGRSVYAVVLPHVGSGALVPPLWTGGLFQDIVMSFAGAFLVGLPFLGSYILGAMGGGDVKFVPPFALFLGWSLAFDFLFLTFLFGGVFAGGMIVVRWVVRRWTARHPGRHPEWERLARMRQFAYAPAIAAAGVVCLAVKWEGLLG
jgi:Flp pilus assembly protein protease CpaA